MACIRKVEIRNFRGIKYLTWFPTSGINCLIGAGDSGKSTIIDAIDLCLGARRSIRVNDTDFYNLDVSEPISIAITLGSLPDSLKSIEVYGDFLRAFNSDTGEIIEEPHYQLETVLTVELTVGSDLEPTWELVSVHADEAGLERRLRWADRVSIAPGRLGTYLNTQLGWSRGSVLNRLADDPVELGPQLADAMRQARSSFGEAASESLEQVLDLVYKTAKSLGVPVGDGVQALLDAHSFSISDGAVSLHDKYGIPLRSLGTGSMRLLVAGLQRASSHGTGLVLVDEVELGLEPHRLQRLLISLGAKEDEPPLQVFMSTHSPVAVRELAANQLWALRPNDGEHKALWAGEYEEVQSAARATPDALLAKTVILCEGKSEVGLVRGLDMYWSEQGQKSLLADGAIAVSFDGGEPERGFRRGAALQRLGYRTIVLVDSDKSIDPDEIGNYQQVGGQYVQWETGRATEHELFLSLPDAAVGALIERAILLRSRESIADQIRDLSGDGTTLRDIENAGLLDGYGSEMRSLLGNVAHRGKWFKQLGVYEDLSREIVGPSFEQSDQAFKDRINRLFYWAHEH